MVAKDRSGQEIKRGIYVTAVLVDEEEECRQGVYVDDNGDGSIQVQGELIPGDCGVYHCKPDCTIVLDSNLFGGAKHLVETLRDQNSWDYRWQH